MQKVLLENELEGGDDYLTLSFDRTFKTIFLSEDVVLNNDFHLLEALISEVVRQEVKVVKLLNVELPVRSKSEF